MKGSLAEGLYFGTAALKMQDKKAQEQPLKAEVAELSLKPQQTAKRVVSGGKQPAVAQLEEPVMTDEWSRNTFRSNIVSIGVPFLRVV